MGGEMAPWEIWVRGTPLHSFVHEHYWIWPVAESVHFIGLSLLIGTVGLYDLRVLGMAKAVPPSSLHKLIPFGIAGFVVNMLTGILFFAAYPEQYAYNRAFHFKLVFMTIAAANVAVFYSAAFRRVRHLGAGATAPAQARVITGISLFAWLGVLICGRLLTFFRPPFFH
jgi:hypothetical protein